MSVPNALENALRILLVSLKREPITVRGQANHVALASLVDAEFIHARPRQGSCASRCDFTRSTSYERDCTIRSVQVARRYSLVQRVPDACMNQLQPAGFFQSVLNPNGPK